MAGSMFGALMNWTSPYTDIVHSQVEQVCSGLAAWQIICCTVILTLVAEWLCNFLWQEEKLITRWKRWFFRTVKSLPIIKDKIQAEVAKMAVDVEGDLLKGVTNFVQRLPERGLSERELMKEVERYKKMCSFEWTSGMCSGTVYNGDPYLTSLMTKVYGMYAWSNPLHADVFPDVRQMEAEVVRMCCSMFNGGPSSCGTMASGGTESILLACKAYRDLGRYNGIKHPEIIVPVSAHAAFDKAADIFCMKITHVPLDPASMAVDVKAMRKAITKNTCMLVGSAPQFPQGIIDNIVEIAKLGLRYNIPVHVDSCLGGFLVPFMQKAGFHLPPFDFSVEGVTSISADTHKYGFAPKGSSVIMYSEKKYRSMQYFAVPDWSGGIYATPTLAGSRAGAIIASCWATMMHIGEEGYIDTTRQIIKTTRYITERIREVEGLFVYGVPLVSVVAVGSLDFNIYRLTDALSKRGWNLNALQYPSSFHICVTLLHTKPGVADRLLTDIEECSAEIMKVPQEKCEGMGALYGMAQSIPDRSMVAEIANCFLDACYSTPSNVANGVKFN